MATKVVDDELTLVDWLTLCEAIAASDSFVRSGHPEDQVILLKAELLRASAEGANWCEIYRSIYEKWHSRRPHFPDLNAMAAEIEHYGSRWKKALAFLLARKDLTMATEPLPHSTVVWVTVAGVQQPRTRWTYTLMEDTPGSPNDGPIRDRPLQTDTLCRSYAELCVWLYRYGCASPPPDYFTPTREEIDEGIESILRRVTRPR